MALIAYEDWNPSEKSLSIIHLANGICREYAQQGYDLTLRQLYYQFVARGYIPNNQRSYKSLGATIDRARKAGLMDWRYIVDRTRNLMGYTTYEDPAGIVEAMEDRYHVDLWEGQDFRVEVWVEKEALAGVVQRAALSRGVDYFSCRGYVSQSELHGAALRHRQYERDGQDVVVVHLGDHDPSGIDMTRDMQDRLELFGARTEVRRIALNRDQIDQYNPPPNPAKITDSRAKGYIAEHDTLANLITAEIDRHLDPDLYDSRLRLQNEGREELAKIAEHWSDVSDYIAGL
jgi:hypothetical protein